MQEESELHWRKEQALFSQLSPKGREEYVQATRNAHIMQNQYIIRSVCGINLFFAALLAYDIYDYSTRNYFIQSYGLIPALSLLVIPPILLYMARPVYSGSVEVKDHTELAELIVAKTSFDPSQKSQPLTIPNIDQLIKTFTYISSYSIVVLVYIVVLFGYKLLFSQHLDAVFDPISQQIHRIPLSTLNALTRWELTLIPVLTFISTISLFHGLVTTNSLRELIHNGQVGYNVQGFYANPEY